MARMFDVSVKDVMFNLCGNKPEKSKAKLDIDAKITFPKIPKCQPPVCDVPVCDVPACEVPVKPVLDKPTDSKPTGPKPTDSKPQEYRPTDSKPQEYRPDVYHDAQTDHSFLCGMAVAICFLVGLWYLMHHFGNRTEDDQTDVTTVPDDATSETFPEGAPIRASKIPASSYDPENAKLVKRVDSASHPEMPKRMARLSHPEFPDHDRPVLEREDYHHSGIREPAKVPKKPQELDGDLIAHPPEAVEDTNRPNISKSSDVSNVPYLSKDRGSSLKQYNPRKSKKRNKSEVSEKSSPDLDISEYSSTREQPKQSVESGLTMTPGTDGRHRNSQAKEPAPLPDASPSKPEFGEPDCDGHDPATLETTSSPWIDPDPDNRKSRSSEKRKRPSKPPSGTQPKTPLKSKSQTPAITPSKASSKTPKKSSVRKTKKSDTADIDGDDANNQMGCNLDRNAATPSLKTGSTPQRVVNQSGKTPPAKNAKLNCDPKESKSTAKKTPSATISWNTPEKAEKPGSFESIYVLDESYKSTDNRSQRGPSQRAPRPPKSRNSPSRSMAPSQNRPNRFVQFRRVGPPANRFCGQRVPRSGCPYHSRVVRTPNPRTFTNQSCRRGGLGPRLQAICNPSRFDSNFLFAPYYIQSVSTPQLCFCSDSSQFCNYNVSVPNASSSISDQSITATSASSPDCSIETINHCQRPKVDFIPPQILFPVYPRSETRLCISKDVQSSPSQQCMPRGVSREPPMFSDTELIRPTGTRHGDPFVPLPCFTLSKIQRPCMPNEKPQRFPPSSAPQPVVIQQQPAVLKKPNRSVHFADFCEQYPHTCPGAYSDMMQQLSMAHHSILMVPGIPRTRYGIQHRCLVPIDQCPMHPGAPTVLKRQLSQNHYPYFNHPY